MRPCFVFAAATAPDQPATLSIYDEIGFWGVQAKDFVDQLNAVSSKVLNVEINSPGGDVFAALTMYNALRASGKEVHTKTMGVAASAASLVFLAGDKRVMPKNTQLMIHNPWVMTAGNADELEETAANLRKIGGSIAATYAARTGMKDEDLQPLLAKDTWMTADEALASGFATDIIEEVKVNAKFDLARADLPESVRAALGLTPKAEDDKQTNPPAEPTVTDPVEPPAAPIADQISDLAAKADLADFAPVFAVDCADVTQAQARIAVAREIKSFCALVKKPEAAAGYIKANKSIADVRAEVAKQMADVDDDTVVDTTPQNKQSAGNSAEPKAINTASLWASHNAQKVKKGS